MNWTLISNISAIVTCTAFILYLIGHIWAVHISKNKIFEKFEFVNEKDIDNIEYVDFAEEYGRIFSVSSPEGIRNIKIFETQQNHDDCFEMNKGRLLKEVKNVKPNQKTYIRANFTDISSNIYLEIKRSDYIKISFLVSDSGKDGSFEQVNYNSKMTFMSWLYYLCK